MEDVFGRDELLIEAGNRRRVMPGMLRVTSIGRRH